MISGGNSPICSGALVDEQWVLTAAHCFYSGTKRPITRPASRYVHRRHRGATIFPPLLFPRNGMTLSLSLSLLHYRYTMKAGGYVSGNTKRPFQVIPAGKIYLHKKYKLRSNANDVALVKLYRKVTLSKFVRPVCMPPENRDKIPVDLALPGKHGFLASWSELLNKRGSRKKGHAKDVVHEALAILTNHICGNTTRQPFDASVMFCAGKAEAGKQCHGDGGGPFVQEHKSRSKGYRWTVSGLVSWNEGCGAGSSHGFFTRVAPYVPWIRKIISDQEKDKKTRKKRLSL